MSQSILRSGMTSPLLAAAKRPSTPRSILKRPTSLALSPALPFNASFSVMVSPSAKSPHVQFVQTPQLVATFVTHSSEVYDRAPIRVSPNPLALPARGARYYSPTIDHFKLSAPPPPKAAALSRLQSILKASQCASPAITEFEDPRSPRAAAVQAPPVQQIRFASFAAPSRQPQSLSKSLSSYPRSPYPSAPLSPAEQMSTEMESRGRRMSDVSNLSSKPTPAIKRPARLPIPPSPLKASFKSPSLQRSHKPAPLDLEPQSATSLSNAFWDSMTLEEGDTPMVTALEYPESAVEMEEVDLKSPAPVLGNIKSPAPALKSPGPALMFGTQDGSVWSPSIPKKPAAREALLRTALMSPGKAAFPKPPAAGKVKHSVVASPSPNDPFASFPSFAAVLTLDTASQASGPLAYPPRAVLGAA
ncbi:hypothetical protein CC2G_000155 [Coprinopsis cinerea AmutBmut pab1-1]|nr:hypothetical protein CC2G_000155 [Coprinopsis cinerea AmutBmut pab1-1]